MISSGCVGFLWHEPCSLMRMKMFLLILAILFFKETSFAGSTAYRTLASIPKQMRIDHAKELLGRNYKKSRVAKFENKENLEQNILQTVLISLPKKFKSKAMKVTQTIIAESTKHSLDPYFVMAVIAGESSFNPTAKGPIGELGLMQIRPETAEWMVKKAKMKWKGSKSLYDPEQNIKIGTLYLSWLRSKFNNHSQLYLAAYNMGAKSVRKSLAKNIKPKDYPIHVMKRYLGYYKKMVI